MLKVYYASQTGKILAEICSFSAVQGQGFNCLQSPSFFSSFRFCNWRIFFSLLFFDQLVQALRKNVKTVYNCPWLFIRTKISKSINFKVVVNFHNVRFYLQKLRWSFFCYNPLKTHDCPQYCPKFAAVIQRKVLPSSCDPKRSDRFTDFWKQPRISKCVCFKIKLCFER